MLFQDGLPPLGPMALLIMAISIILVDILFLRIALAITKAQEKTNMKWVAASFGIQFGIIFFVLSPLILYAMMGRFHVNPRIVVIGIIVVIFALFIDLNVINVIHKIGLKRSFVVMIFVVAPIVTSVVFISRSLG